MTEIAQIIAQIKTFEELRFITQDINCDTIKIINWGDFTEEEQLQLQAVIEMIKGK